ncbi:MAG TPA: M28 family peptidase [Bryobacteraceae bacterium]|nr:M28 family peptidase [Bryobacteraceae bacterium]
MRKTSALIVVCLTCLCSSQIAAPPKPSISGELQAAIDLVRAAPLRGDLSFLASDLLEGRDTPSRGLDIAAEYIAAQFRSAGLEPGGDDGYYQSARMAVSEPNPEGIELKFSRPEASFTADPKDLQSDASAALDISREPVFKLDVNDSALVGGFTAGQVEGKVVVTEFARGGGANIRSALGKLREAKPAAIVTIDRRTSNDQQPGKRLIDPEMPSGRAPRIRLAGPDAARFYAVLKAGPTDAFGSIHVAQPRQTPVSLHNVIGILRGSDPALKNTCILLTAHYDHLGRLADGPGDRIYNGANDDGSGTVSVIEVARALATLHPHPRRSIVFMTFFGEEEGLVGSHYYARHPAWPLDKTIAQLNLEQVGRTDSSEGPQISNATLTGFDYSDLSGYLSKAGELTGIKLYKHPHNSDAYFRASDNLSLAEAGVPAHTLAVSFEFPDYHGLGDEWQKIDYDNMAKVDRMIALALVTVANSDEPVHWNEKNSKAEPFIKAGKERRP